MTRRKLSNHQGTSSGGVLSLQSRLEFFLLHRAKVCDSTEEARVVADDLIDTAGLDEKDTERIVSNDDDFLEAIVASSDVASRITKAGEAMATAMVDTYGFYDSEKEAQAGLIQFFGDMGVVLEGGNTLQAGNDGEAEGGEEAIADDEIVEEDDSSCFIGEGECEFCERDMKLTRHHLIPKTTWSRIKKKILQATESTSTKANDFLQHFNHILPSIRADHGCQLSLSSKALSFHLKHNNNTCNICRPCHSMIHNQHDNMTLALQYNTVEKLLEDPDVVKFCKWAHKQKPGNFSSKR
jgi:hypothetical protein